MVHGLILVGQSLQVGHLQGASISVSVSLGVNVLGGHRKSFAVPAGLAPKALPLLCVRGCRWGRIPKWLGVHELFHDGALKARVAVCQLDHDGTEF